jgi:hypothetical protein
MRVVFVSNGLRTGGKRLRPPRYWVFRGPAVVFRLDTREEFSGCLKVVVAGTTVGYWNPVSETWRVLGGRDVDGPGGRRVFEADRMYSDALPYTLEGREWDVIETVPTPCVFCNKRVWHINDPKGRGTAWTLAARAGGKGRQYLYCNRPNCNNEHVWTCVECNIDTVDRCCPECSGPRRTHDREDALARGENV